MADPPETTRDGEQGFRSPRGRDPMASSLDPTDIADPSITITTPTGSTEVLTQSSASGDQSDQENDEEVFFTPNASAWEPPVDLSALKLSHTSIRERTTSMPLSVRRIRASLSGGGGGYAAAPLMDSNADGKNNNSNTNDENGGSRTSPTLNLPLPPSNKSTPSTGGSKRSTTPSSSAAKATYLTRNAQRYSSLKKKKRPSTLLNRLFCNSPVSGSNSVDDEDDASADGGRKNLSTKLKNDKSEPEESTCCLLIGKSMLEQASENLTLHDEAKVRESVQSSLSDSLAVACATPNTSPPTFSVSNHRRGAAATTSSTDDRTTASASVQEKPVKLVGLAAIGLATKTRKTSSKTTDMSLDEDGIQEPSTKLSLHNDLDDIAETASRPPRNNVTKQADKATHSGDNVKTPSSSFTKPMKTPGGLVIPTPFMCSGKGLFPNTLDKIYTKPTVEKSPNRDVARNSPTVDRKAHKAQKSNTKNKKKVGIMSSLDALTMPASLTSSSSSCSENNEDRIEKQRSVTSPPTMIRIASSNEDLCTVQEATESKETASNEGLTHMPSKSVTSNVSALSLSKEVLSGDTLKDAQDELCEEFGRASDIQSKSVSFSSGDPQTYDYEAEMRAKYERQINEQKDKLALATRLAKQRLEEIESLEATMDEMKDRQSDMKLQRRIDQFEAEKKKEVEHVKAQMEALMEEKVNQAKIDATAQHTPEILRVEEELEQLKSELAEARELTNKSPNKELSELSTSTAEVSRLTKELTEVKAELAAKTENSDMDSELEAVKDELEDVKDRLASKEKELEETIKKHMPSSAKKTPSRIPSPSQRNTALVKHGNKSHDESTELYEREKETLREQIALLDQQLSQSSKEHENALSELRKNSEQEIQQVKKEMENKLEHHLEKERELKESLSTVDSRQKEELLEQIEQLQAEKKHERSDVLREVQKKEDLLQRIADLEEREKQLIGEHERSIQDLRTKGDLEIQQLRNEMQQQDLVRAARERELEQAVSETSSFEKEELNRKIERLQSQLDSERNSLVVVKVKLANMEKEAEESKSAELQELKSTKDAEIKVLTEQVDELSALEDVVQITSNERDIMKEELQKIKSQLDESTAAHSAKIDELLTKHTDETAALEKEHHVKVTSLQVEMERLAKEGKKKEDDLSESLLTKYEAKFKDLSRQHAEEKALIEDRLKAAEANRDLLVEAAEEKRKSLQKSSDEKVSALEEKLKKSDEQIKEAEDKLKSLQKSSDEKITFLESELQSAMNKTGDEEKRLRKLCDELRAKQMRYEVQLKSAEDNHNKQFEDLLAQLDLVEEEHQQTIEAKEKALVEKEAIVDALGSQLAEARDRLKKLEETLADQESLTQKQRRHCVELEHEVKSLTEDLQSLNETHKKFMKEAVVEKEKACEVAREEMIEKAEDQFQQANEHYVKLRKQYDESQSRSKKLEGELKAMKRKFEKMGKEKESCEIDLKAEIAKVNAANAKIEADAAQKAREYRREMERLLQTAQDFEAKAKDADSTSRNIQTTLATVVAEKEQLQKEYEEMKSVSEELMAIVEGQERHEC